MVTISYDEYCKYTENLDLLRIQCDNFRQQVVKLQKEIEFLKDRGDNILVIVKHTDKPDRYEYKSSEKELLYEITLENSKIRERYDELSRKNDNIENQKQLIILKYREMENYYQNLISKLEEYNNYLENRSLIDRIKNTKKNVKNINIISYVDTKLLDVNITQTIYSEEEIKKLEEDAKKIKKPRGWHFQDEFVDSAGNVYYKGKLQPHLKNK